MAEALVKSGDAGAYSFSAEGAWVSLDGGLSSVWLFKHKDNSSARVVAKSTADQKYVINSSLGAGCTVAMVSSNFLQWSSAGCVWGLNFADADAAALFARRMQQTIEAVVSCAAKAVPEAAAPADMPVSLKPSAEPASVVTSTAGASGSGDTTGGSIAPEPIKPIALEPPPSVSTPETRRFSSGPRLREANHALSDPTRRRSRTLAEESQLAPASVAQSTAARQTTSNSSSGASSPVLGSALSSSTGDLAEGQVRKMTLESWVQEADANANSPKVGRASGGAAGANRTNSSLRFKTNRGSTSGAAPANPVLSNSGSIASPTTLRFSKKKPTSWKDLVDMGSPRSSTMRFLEQATGAAAAATLLTRDPATLSHRERVIRELCTTELSYCKNLQQVVKICVPIANAQKVFKPEQQAQIFGNIDDVYTVNTKLLMQLHASVAAWDDATSLVGEVLIRSLATFAPYTGYLAEYSSALKVLEELETKKKAVQAYCQLCQDECAGMTLTSLLVTPVQRIPRYQLLLQEIIKTTAEEHPDLENLRQALVAVKRYAEDMNKAVKMSENKKEFARLSQIVEGLSAIRTPLLWSDEKVRVNVDGDEPATNLILFSDRLVFVRNNAVVLETPLHCAWVKPVGKAAESVFQVITPERKILVEADIPQIMVQWTERISQALDADLAEREYSDPEVAGGRRFAFKWQLPNNGVAIYQGQWLDARPSGHGKYKYATKASYEGTFVQGKRHGKGKMMYQTGEYYDGDWEDDAPSGQGKMSTTTSEYVGAFVAGLPCGAGKVTHADGSTYEGTFVGGQYSGTGRFVDAVGSSYEGEYKDGMRHGQGRFVCCGLDYTGAWHADRQHGTGRLRSPAGHVYEGTFSEGQPCGDGVLSRRDGATYRGAFKDGVFDGKGVLTLKDGTCYEGSFAAGLRSGRGLQKYADGATYDGEWQNGVRHGAGKWVDADGTTSYEGGWEMDLYQGRGKLIADGRVVYDGQWKQGRKDGKGYSTFPDGTKYTGGYSGDRREGVGVLETGPWKYAGDWKQGRRHGEGELSCATYRYEGGWVDDRRSGKGKERFPELYATFEGEFQADTRVRGKVSIEAPGKTPLEFEVDYSKFSSSQATRLPPPMVGPQILTLEM